MYGRIPYLNISLISWAIHGSDLRRLLYYIEVWLGTSPSVPLTLSEIGFDIPIPHLYGDNLGSLFWSTNPVQEKRSKHIDIRYHYVRDVIEDDKIKLYYIDEARNPADILTKNLDQILFHQFCPLLGLEVLWPLLLIYIVTQWLLVTNFIWPYLHQFFDNSHGLKASLKPLRRPFDRYQSHLEAISIGQDIRQINW